MSTEENSLVKILDNKTITSSRIVADEFEKRHDRVLRTIDNLRDDLPHFGEYFWESVEPDGNGRNQRVYLMNFDGFCLVGLGFTGERALKFKVKFIKAFKDMAKKLEQVPQIPPSEQLLQLQESFDKLTEKLENTGLITPMTNYRYEFDKLNVFYRDSTGDDGARGIHEACGDYFGFPVPYSKDLKTTLRDYILLRISDSFDSSIEELKKFIMGIKSNTIVKSPMGHWVNLNGFGGNSVEWKKVLQEFNHKCAYCGRSDVPLIPEHIVPQSVMSLEHPEWVDLCGSVVCACGECNGSKGKLDMESWYRKHPKFSLARLRKIKKHQLMYSLEEL